VFRSILLKKNFFILIIIGSVASSLAITASQYSIQTSNEIRSIASEDIAASARDEVYDLSRVVVNKIDSVTTNLEVLASAPSIQSGNSKGIEQLFDAAQYSTEDLTEYYMWLDSAGSIMSASNIARASYQYNSMWKSEMPPFLTEPRQTASVYYSSMIHSPTDNADRLYISYPIVSSLQDDQSLDGEFRGVIAASIRMDTLGGILTSELSPTLESDASLSDISGNIVYSVERSVIGRNIFDDPVYLTTPLFTGLSQQSKQELTSLVKSANSGQKAEVTNLSIGGKTVTIASHPIIQKGVHFWTLYITAPHVFTDSVDELLAKQDSVIVLTLFFIGAVSIGVAYLVLSWNKRLEATVKDRTLELDSSNASLVEANTRLEGANEQLTVHANRQREYVNRAAHELRTPVMPILGITDLLESNFRHDGVDQIVLKKDDFEIISRNSRRLERLANDILDVSRIDTRSLKLNLEEFNIHEMIHHIVADTTNQFPNDRVRYAIEAEKELVIRADKSKTAQVLSNLLNNAAKFTDEGEIKVSCKMINGEAAGEENLQISVSDTGTGIDSSIFPRLFTKFSNKPGMGRSQVGSGLGLYVSKGIVEAHGGRIWAVNNENGKGCTVSISIPSFVSLMKDQ
jgi:signal transduction histidine kinase